MILNAAHATEEGYSAVVVTADDTDVLLLCLAFSADISCPLFQNCGTKNRVRYLDITKLRQALGDCVCNAVIGMYAYTGCDTLSAFAGRGKLRALKLIMRSEHFQEVFHKLGHVGSSSLASCHHVSLQQNPHVPSPVERGWARNDDGQLTVECMRGSPAPEAVLQLLSCNYSRRCKLPECQCMSSGLKCTNLFKLQTCDNQPQEEGLGMMITEADLTDSETED
ncbi:hypothetical protein AAFF_G00392650 [Aldrovandia affinis]|uniref:Tesmin/TSO1-like CXC domain-containing protein n=1 Tax=Aldrovandia affinis TaxID=143900 RepID=A0AAD7SGA6_9TELE|nr:hypothetical protein AAFF_G00392650 [Aldrovandia affinis]